MNTAATAALRVVMFVYGDVAHDARVLREAGSLARAGHRVTVMARPADPTARHGSRARQDGFDIVCVPVPGGWRRPWRVVGLPVRLVARAADRLRRRTGVEETIAWLVIWRFAILGWAKAAAAAAPPADVFHGHDLTGLPAAVAAARRDGGRVVYDSHEIYLESGRNAHRPAWLRRRLARQEQTWIRSTDALVTVNAAILDDLARRYDTPPGTAIYNCPPRWQPGSAPDGRLRAAVGCPTEAPLALYHGAFSAHRGLEQLADALIQPGMERVHAAYLGYGSRRPLLDRMAADPRYGGRVHVLGPVPPEDVVAWVSGADVAVIALQPSTLNHLLSTPNKVFEALAAGVPVVASDFPGLRAVVVDTPGGPLGEVCDPSDPAAIGTAIRRIVEAPPSAVADLRRRCLAAAHERWNWETESKKLLDLYASLGGSA